MPDSVVQVANKELDPSALSTQQVWREIAALKELIFARLSEQDKAVVLLQSIANRSPTVNEVYLQHEEKFRSIQRQFEERDARTEQSAKDTKTAVDAALAAQEKAVQKQNEAFTQSINKSEASITKQIDALNDKIIDVKDRTTILESRSTGEKVGSQSQQRTMMMIVSLIVSLLVIGGIVVSIAFAIRK